MIAAMTPSFSIYEPNSTDQVSTLKSCFIQRMQFKRNDLPAQLCGDDGLVYQVVYDCRVPEGMFFDGIISFQQHTYGKFAIVRVARDKKLGE
jgi:hypothetical protein